MVAWGNITASPSGSGSMGDRRVDEARARLVAAQALAKRNR